MSTDRHTDDMPKNEFFGISMPQNVEIHQNLEIDFLDQCNTFSILRIVEKVKKSDAAQNNILQNTHSVQIIKQQQCITHRSLSALEPRVEENREKNR